MLSYRRDALALLRVSSADLVFLKFCWVSQSWLWQRDCGQDSPSQGRFGWCWHFSTSLMNSVTVSILILAHGIVGVFATCRASCRLVFRRDDSILWILEQMLWYCTPLPFCRKDLIVKPANFEMLLPRSAQRSSFQSSPCPAGRWHGAVWSGCSPGTPLFSQRLFEEKAACAEGAPSSAVWTRASVTGFLPQPHSFSVCGGTSCGYSHWLTARARAISCEHLYICVKLMFYVSMVSVFRYQRRAKALKEWGCLSILAYSNQLPA